MNKYFTRTVVLVAIAFLFGQNAFGQCMQMPPPSVGTFSTSVTLDGDNPSVICFGTGDVNFTSNGDNINPTGASAGTGWAIYFCPPDPSLGQDFQSDPCFTGFMWTGENFNTQNVNGNGLEGVLNSNSSYDGQWWLLPTQFDALGGGGYTVDSNMDDCWDIDYGSIVNFTFLPEFQYTANDDCGGVATITIDEGGYPDVFGGSYNISNAGVGALSTTSPGVGQVITISGLNPGDTYGINIDDDGNGCTDTYTATYSPTVVDATFDYGGDIFVCSSGSDPASPNNPGGTFSFNPPPGDGASIDPSTGVISNSVDGASYTVEYTTVASGSDCPDTQTFNVTGDATPPLPDLPATFEACVPQFPNGSTTIVPGANGGPGDFNYYSDPGATVLLGSGGNYDPGILGGSSATVYVTQVSANGCESAPVQIDITGNETLDEPLFPDLSDENGNSVEDFIYCEGSPLNTNIAPFMPGAAEFNFYIDGSATPGFLIANGPDFDPSSFYPLATTPFYLWVTSVSFEGCESDPTQIELTEIEALEVQVTVGSADCSSPSINVDASLGGGANGGEWGTGGDGTFLVPSDLSTTYTPGPTDIANGTVTVTFVVDDPGLPCSVVVDAEAIDLTATGGSVSGTEAYTGCVADGYSVMVDGTLYNESNPTGTEMLTTNTGCDSIVTIDLVFNSPTTGSEPYTGCVGDGHMVTVNGTVYNEANPTGTETLPAFNGCDSVVTINLDFQADVTGMETHLGCVGDGHTVTVDGTVYDETNPTGTETLTAFAGCDSVVTINLVFNSDVTGTESHLGCVGDAHTVTVGGTIYNEANPTGTETLPAFNGCDSVVTVNLVFNTNATGTESYTGCVGDGHTATVGGTVYDETNPTGTETLPAFNGCDSVVTINFVFNAGTTGTESHNGCIGDGHTVTVGGTLYDEANPTGTETLPAFNGCDSVVTINLSFANGVTGTESHNGCIGDGYNVTVDGTIYNETNPTGTEVLTAFGGCDSTVTINLTFANGVTGIESHSGCVGDGHTVTVDGTVYDETNPTGTETLTAFGGCDSVVTINLVFNAGAIGTESHIGCVGDGHTATVGGTLYNEANPTGTETLPAFNGCDSVVTVNLVFNSNTTGTETHTGCVGDGHTATVGGTVYNEANPTGTETLPAFNGCDSVVTVNFVFNAGTTGSELHNGCIGDGHTVTVGGTVYNEANPTGTETLTAFNGCDSTVTINLNFANGVTGNANYTGCTGDGHSENIGGTLYNEANPTGTETLTAFGGCDSVVTVNFTFNSFVTGTESYVGCVGDAYVVNVDGTPYNEANPTGSETLTAFNGCDSIVTINLVFNNGVTGTATYTGCQGDGHTETIGGTVYNEANPTGTETLNAFNGCDSVVTINFMFNTFVTGTESYTGCTGDGHAVTVGGTLYNEANPTGTETVPSSSGCDSIVTINLEFNTFVTGSESFNGCSGDTYSVTVDGTLYNEANPSGTETLTSFNGCDSIVTIDLVYGINVTGIESYTGCSGDGHTVTVDGTVYNEANPTGTETLTSFAGCDSVVTVNLVFNSSTTGIETYTGCIGDGYNVTVGATVYDETLTSGIETLNAFNGCDSVVTVALTFNNPSTGTESYTGCSGDGHTATVGGTIYNEANPTGTETIPAFNGCDSVVTVNFVFNGSSSSMFTNQACTGDGYSVTIGGTVYNETNQTGTETLVGFSGCDSVVMVNLTFSNFVTGSELYTGCMGDGYMVTVDGTIYDEANPVGTETIPSSIGCDSIITINLTYNGPVTGSETYNGCNGDGYDVMVDGTIYNEANPTGTETLTAFNGCDSVVSIALTFNTFLSGDELYTGCTGDGYAVTVDGTIYNEANPTGTETLVSSIGCDSIVTVNLTFNTFLSSNVDYAGCVGDGYSVMVNGMIYNEANPTGTETTPSSIGCDSIISVDLVFNAPVMEMENHLGCEGDGYSVLVNGTVYNETNATGTETMLNFRGCDSTVMIDLQFGPTTIGTESYTGCAGDGYFVNVGGTIYNEANASGMETVANAAGCDSIVTVSLTFNNAVFGNVDYAGCNGDGFSVNVGGTIYNEANPTGMETIPSSLGCDSIVTIAMTFNAFVSSEVNHIGCAGDGFSVNVNGTVYDETNPNGMETIAGGSAAGCDSIITVDLDFLNSVNSAVNETLCEGQFITVNGTVYNAANPTGVETISSGSFLGCDSIINVAVDFYAPALNNVVQTLCFGQSLEVNGEIYSETNPTGMQLLTGASFNGCDSTIMVDLTFDSAVMFNLNETICQEDEVMVNGQSFNFNNPVGSVTFVNGSYTGCDSIVNVSLDFLEPISASLQGDEFFCEGEEATLEFLLDGGTNFDVEYTDGFNNFTLLGIESGHEITVSPFAMTTYTIINISTTGNICDPLLPNASVDVDIDMLAIDAIAETDFQGFGTSCDGSEDGIVSASIEIDGQGPFAYSWSNGAITETVENLSAGEYTVTVTDALGCESIDSITLDEPDPFDIFLEVNEVSCFGENDGVVLVDSVDGGFGPYVYSLNEGIFSSFQQFSNLTAGVYEVAVQDMNGCETVETLTVDAPSEVQVDLGNDLSITLGEEIELDAQVNIPPGFLDTLIWQASDTLPCDTCLFQVVTPLATTSYSIMVVDENGCIAEDELNVVVSNDRPIFVPNAFSPNNDGVNEILFLNLDPNAVTKVNSFLIFDRWGEIVFEANPADFEANSENYGWDGTLKGQPLNPAVFVYWLEVEFKDGVVEMFSGDITLMR